MEIFKKSLDLLGEHIEIFHFKDFIVEDQKLMRIGIKSLFTDGVLLADQMKLRVQWVGDTRVSGTVEGDTETYNCVVSAGFGITDGCLKLLENWYGLHVDTAAAVNPRAV